MTMIFQSRSRGSLKPVTLGLMAGIFILICLILAAGVVPRYIKIQKIRQEIDTLAIELEQQKQLFPLYAKSKKLESFAFLPKLPFPERRVLDRNKISQLSTTFDQLAVQNQLTVTGNSLDIQKIENQTDPEKVSIELYLSGHLIDFRRFMIAVAGLPFFDMVQHLKIEPVDNTNKKFNVKIRMNIDKK